MTEFVAGYQNTGTTNTDKQDLQCFKCSKVFKYKRNLRRHVRECGAEPNIFCHFCPHKTNRKHSMKVHLKLKHGADYLE